MPRVLVVDDEPDLRFLLRRLFEASGYEVDEAVDGRAGLERFRSSRPDLVITDGEMPRMDGGEFIREMRGEPGGSVPVILWSANPRHYEGADRTLTKPYGGSELLACAAELLGKDS